MGNLVAIVGRPNVGKSTLFNRLTQSRQAIVSDVAGTTRDRQYGKCEWCGKEFSIVDTGGWVVNSDDIFEDAIRQQVLIATEEADLVLFLVDVQTGVTDLDTDVAEILRRTKLPVILVSNKTDNTIVTDYNAAPGLLEINGDGSFTYTTSAAPSSEMASTGCSGQKVYGSWEINDASVKFTVKTGDCATSGTVTPVVDELQMNFNGVRFQAGDATDAMTKANSTEIYDRVE